MQWEMKLNDINIINPGDLNHLESEGLLEEKASESNKIINHTNVTWLSQGYVSQRFVDLLEEIKFFMTKKNKILKM
jgi:hypothetical protein